MFFVDTNAMGGGEKYVADLVNALAQPPLGAAPDSRTATRYEIVVACGDFPEFVEFIRREAGNNCRAIPLRLPSVTRLRAAQAGMAAVRKSRGRFGFLKVGGQILSYVNAAVCFWRLLGVFRNEKPDILHISNGGYPAAESHRAAVLAARLAGVPRRLMTVHNLADNFPPLAFIDRRIDRWVEGSLHGLWAVSEGSRRTLIEKRGFDARRVGVVHNGFQPRPAENAESLRKELGLPSGNRVIGNIGGLQPRKGHKVLLDAFAEVKKTAPDVHLLILGEGPCRPELEEQARSLGLEDSVSLPGHRREASRYLPAFDVFVFPSTGFESFPYVILEAMAAGKPVVATDVGGTAEQIVHERTGLLIPPSDKDAMVRAILRALKGPEESARWAQEAKRDVREKFSLERMVQNTEKFYSERT